jgi:hypothetical protein
MRFRPWRHGLLALLALADVSLGGCDDRPRPEAATPPSYVVARPPLGAVRVVDLSGETPTRELLARTLQGVVNRKEAHLYVVGSTDPDSTDPGDLAARGWLDVYGAEVGLTVASTGTLDDALAEYAAELEGYFVASTEEPWTIDAATTAAAAGRDAVVATEAEAGALDGLGLARLDSFVGRWDDATSCYLELAQQIGSLPHPGFAVQTPERHAPRDFFIQQGIVTLAGFPTEPAWEAVEAALERVPPGAPIYGYPARVGAEELTSVVAISKAGDVLVPSDTTANLSLHVAVRPASFTPAPPAATDVDCEAAELNVVVGLTDGDNLVLPITRYPGAGYWASPDRGAIPIAWSMPEGLAELAPAAFDHYVRTLAPGDELVDMIGPGYVYASQMPNADWFYDVAFDAMSALGYRVLWIFDPLDSKSRPWSERAEAAMDEGLAGLLDGYYPSLVGRPPSEEHVGRVPVIRATNRYDDGPDEIAAAIRALLAEPRDERPRVAFFSASAWENDVTGLVAALAPLEGEGVRFVNASTGMRCVSP